MIIKKTVLILKVIFFLGLISFAHAEPLEYKYYSDGSCKPDTGSQCVTKEKMADICRKTKAWYQDVLSTQGLLYGGVAQELEKNMGKKAFQNIKVYVSKDNSCMFKYDLVGTLNGTTYNKTYYCEVMSIEDDGQKKTDSLAVKTAITCFN